MSRGSAVRSRKQAIRKRALFERESEGRFYSQVSKPVLCAHVRHLRTMVNDVTVAFRCYDCGLGGPDD